MTSGTCLLVLRQCGRLSFLIGAVSFFTFFMMDIAPGDPAEILLSDRFETPTPENIAALRKELGLDDPFLTRYFRWLKDIGRLNLGRSYRTGDPVAAELASRIPATALLAAAAFLFTVTVSMVAGTIGALFYNRIPDRICRFWAVLSVSVPDYWLGLLLVLVFALQLEWFPVMGLAGVRGLVLPVVTLGLSISAVQGRVLRASMLEVMSRDYIRFALVKGLPFAQVFRRHILKNALLPVVALWGTALGQLLGGAVIVETVFAWPGVGKMTVEAVLNRDFPLVQGAVLFMSITFILVSRLFDLVYHRIDSRVRL
jgi:ABC-type dipeptide/oligopeptide/nickel transport system permease component